MYWIVDCACEVSIKVQNPLPMELMVKNLILLTEGCKFEAIPVRLNLPSNYGSNNDQNSATIKLLGVPRYLVNFLNFKLFFIYFYLFL